MNKNSSYLRLLRFIKHLSFSLQHWNNRMTDRLPRLLLTRWILAADWKFILNLWILRPSNTSFICPTSASLGFSVRPKVITLLRRPLPSRTLSFALCALTVASIYVTVICSASAFFDLASSRAQILSASAIFSGRLPTVLARLNWSTRRIEMSFWIEVRLYIMVLNIFGVVGKAQS